jgi:phosphoglycerol transferase MdoB-like AlkP superfamily enzyme
VTFRPRLRFALTHALVFIGASTLLRLALSVAFRPSSKVRWTEWVRAFVVGFHFDLAVAAVLFVPLALWVGLVSYRIWQSRFYRGLTTAGLGIAWSVLIFLLLAEGFFFEEFRSRFNTVAIDYLIYPSEVFGNLRASYNLPVLVGLCVALAVGPVWLGWRLVRHPAANLREGRVWLLVWIGVATLFGLSVRLDEARFSAERTLNEIANNSSVSLLTAALTRNLDYAHFYPSQDRGAAFARARRLLLTPGAKYSGPPDSLQRTIPGDPNRPRLNVVLLLEESLGSEFWGVLGRPDTLTPRMDALARTESLLFTNLYADGNRTVRGYEGVFCSFPPLPGDSIAVRDRSENVETLARVLSRDGYETMFLYAGRGLFDGTRAFTTANGWEHFVELKDFEKPAYTTVWGVCNEDLYDRTLEEMRKFHQRGEPFFVTTMSVSNHKPYLYPAGRIPEDPLEKKRNHAVKYSDYALGRFFDQARKEAFWKDTIFVVVADHGARVYGSQSVPIRSYEIPLVIAGPAVVKEPQTIPTLGCQLDVAPTILGLIGRPYESTFFGRDLLAHPNLPGRVLLHHNRSVGIYREQHLVTFSLNKVVEYYVGNPKLEQMRRVPKPDDLHQELESEATALYQVGDDLYMHRRYRLLTTNAPATTTAR